MYKTFISIFFCLSIALSAQEDKKTNLITTTGDVAKLIVAKQKLYAGNYNGALSIYHEVEKNDPKNASVKYYIGLCYFNMAQNQNAKESLTKAIELKEGVEPATYFVLGQIFHSEGDIDKALEHFTTFTNSKAGSTETQQQAAVYMEQCNTAKRLMANPWKVNISNLGNEVNSRFDDKNPCITADGKKLVFTTRRPEGAKDMVDSEGDGKFFENVYLSQLDSAKQLFINVSPLDKHINSPAHDACTSISPDGKQLFIYRNDINNKESRGGNVFVSKQLNGKWKNPENLGKPINTTANWEGGVCVSPDGKRYFFTSERKGGFGGSDIWMVERKSKKVWGEPVNLGATVNSKFDEAGMFLAPDGKTLFFCSNGPNSMGGYDIFKTIFENGQWCAPINVGYPINSTAKEGQLTLSANGNVAYISSNRNGGLGESDLYRIELNDYAILEKDGIKRNANGLSILKGTIREGSEGYVMPDVDVIVKDGNGNEVASTSTGEGGEYFVTLPGGHYTLIVKKKGYKDVSESFDISASNKETISLEKGYLLKK